MNIALRELITLGLHTVGVSAEQFNEECPDLVFF
jgi:hypothetical protein